MSEGPTWWLQLPDGSKFGPGTIERMVRWAQEGRIPAGAVLVPTDGGAGQPVLQVPQLAAILQAPPTVRVPVQAPAATSSTMAAVIPYRNPPALVGYYLAVFSLIPFLGLLLGPAALACGIIGLRRGLKDAQARGKVHAWVAIILGAITTLGNWGMAILAVIASAS